MKFAIYKGVPIGRIKKSGSCVAKHHGQTYYAPTLAGLMLVLDCVIL